MVIVQYLVDCRSFGVAPIATFKAYKKAQNSLKSQEDMTFYDEGIDAFLPNELKSHVGWVSQVGWVSFFCKAKKRNPTF